MDVKYCKCGCRTVVTREYIGGHKNKRKSSVMFYVEDRGYKSCCWVWNLGINEWGYGKITKNRKTYSAHKYYWEKVNGKVPDGLDLDHLCRVRNCIRPDHLEPVSEWENCVRGNVAKLTKEDIPKMVAMYKSGTGLKDIGIVFNISSRHIRDILRGKYWKNLIPNDLEVKSQKKLTIDNAADIRKRNSNGESIECIAKDYDVTSSTIYKIMENKIWKDGVK